MFVFHYHSNHSVIDEFARENMRHWICLLCKIRYTAEIHEILLSQTTIFVWHDTLSIEIPP